MARVTVEDCLTQVRNRFELVLLASKRARQIAIEGKDPLVPIENDKPTVIALREIADGLIDASLLEGHSVEPKTELTEVEIAEIASEQGDVVAVVAEEVEEEGSAE